MSVIKVVSLSVVAGIVVAGMVSGTALAWHPEGKIKKSVQNVTNTGVLSDANDAATAVSANPGDTLKYVIEVSNVGKAADNGTNDMTNAVMTDTLPAGIQLVSDPAQRDIKEMLGTIKPGQTITKEYLVKVTAAQNGTIENKACFTGNTAVNDNPQNGCDVAIVSVTVPQILTAATTIIPPALPKTGPENVFGLFVGTTGVGYALHRIVRRKR